MKSDGTYINADDIEELILKISISLREYQTPTAEKMEEIEKVREKIKKSGNKVVK